MSETRPQQRHGGASLGVGLALGVVGALAAVGALRRGSRSKGPRYYHVTTREAADDILANGFLPGWGDVGFGVYFYGSPESARAYAARGGWDRSLLDEHVVILGVEDARIRQILSHELDAAWDKSKYSDMYVLDVDEDDDGHLKVDRVSLYLDLGRATAGSRNPGMAPGYRSWSWVQQDWRSVELGAGGALRWSRACGAKGTRSADGRPALCLPLAVIEELAGSAAGRQVLKEQAERKAAAAPGARVPWHPEIKRLHAELEAVTPKDRAKRRGR